MSGKRDPTAQKQYVQTKKIVIIAKRLGIIPQRRSRCSYCNRTTHESANCPEKRKAEPNIYKIDSNRQSDICKISSVIVNDTKALVDPGSTRTLIQKLFAKNVGVSQCCAVTLNGFGGGYFFV